MKYKALLVIMPVLLILSACSKSKQNDEPLINSIYKQVEYNSNNQDDEQLKVEIYSQEKPISNSTTDDFLKTITAETATAKGLCGSDLTWYYKDNVLVIKGTGEMTNWEDATTPYMPWHAAGIANQIVHIYIEDGVTSIGDYAFSFWYRGYSSAVSRVVVGKDIKSIGDGAFADSNEHGIDFIFKGDMPENMGEILKAARTIYYSGLTFDELSKEYPEIEWIKQ